MKGIFLSELFPAGTGSPQAALHDPFMAGFGAITPVLSQCSRQLSGPALKLGILGLIKLPCNVCTCKKNLVVLWNAVTDCRKKPHSPFWPASGLQ